MHQLPWPFVEVLHTRPQSRPPSSSPQNATHLQIHLPNHDHDAARDWNPAEGLVHLASTFVHLSFSCISENDKFGMTSSQAGLDRDTKAVTCDVDFYLKRFIVWDANATETVQWRLINHVTSCQLANKHRSFPPTAVFRVGGKRRKEKREKVEYTFCFTTYNHPIQPR
jgi:hypothetical protein